MLVGTPPQPQTLKLDTGSSDVRVNLYTYNFCQTGVCWPNGQFDPDSSHSLVPVNHDFKITYASGETIKGDYVTDSLSLAGQRLAEVQIGLGTESTLPEGIFGIGYGLMQDGALDLNGQQVREPPPSIFNLLLEIRAINTKAFSLWHDSSSSGNLLLGGVDIEKFAGDLITIPIRQVSGKYIAFLIILDDVKFSHLPKSGGSPAPNKKRRRNPDSTIVAVDSGSQTSFFPNDLTFKIWDAMDAKFGGGYGHPEIDCALAQSKATMDLIFGSITIPIPVSALIFRADGNPIYAWWEFRRAPQSPTQAWVF